MQLDLIPTSAPAAGSEPSGDRTDADPFRRDAEGTRRYRGSRGRRGPAGAAKIADEHIAMALAELAGARRELAAAYATPTEERQARREAFAGALAKIALAGRFVDQVLIAHGSLPSDCETPQ